MNRFVNSIQNNEQNSKKNNKQAMGIYVHIPFCVRKCVYCDFLSAPADDATKKAYMKALIKEIEYFAKANAKEVEKRTVKTIFFGGGTPTVVEPEDITKVLDIIRKNFLVEAGAEITIECNPGTLDEKKASEYVKAGINRISFGLQSPDDKLLKMLGRIHTFAQFDESVRIARAAGISNINIDVMSALPGQSLAGYIEGLKKVLEYEPEHISAYSLIVEEGTPLCENLKSFPKLPEEDEEREMYYETDKLLKAYGYERYEISNYAKVEKECRHNLSYWDRVDYMGFGLGAASLFSGKRMNNISDIEEYIRRAGCEDVYEEVTVLSKEDSMEEFMFLGLRKICGVSLKDFKQSFGVNMLDVYGDIIRKNVKAGLLEYVNCCDEKEGTVEGIRLTSKGIDVSNMVLADFLLS